MPYNIRCSFKNECASLTHICLSSCIASFGSTPKTTVKQSRAEPKESPVGCIYEPPSTIAM